MDDKNTKIASPEEALNFLGQFIDNKAYKDYEKPNPAIKVIYDKARLNSKYKDYTDEQFKGLELAQVENALKGAILERISSTLPKAETIKETEQPERRAEIRQKADEGAKGVLRI